jgi:hypothetical protein
MIPVQLIGSWSRRLLQQETAAKNADAPHARGIIDLELD